MKKQKQEEIKNKSVVVTFRVFQAIFLGIFALGISMMFGDYSAYIKSPFATISIVTSIFGFMVSIITGIVSKQAKKW